MASRDELKKMVAEDALSFIKDDMIVGVGTGSTVNFFIEQLANIKHRIEGAVASSLESEKRLKALNIPVFDLNSVREVPIYIDGCDEFNDFLYLIKGGGGALTREKIIASAAKQFICIADESKHVGVLGKFPVAVEVIPMARSYVAREIVKLRADPVYREHFITDNGNIILDIHNLDLTQPNMMEQKIKDITGVVENGIFAKRSADRVLMATRGGVKYFEPK